jgi:integrase
VRRGTLREPTQTTFDTAAREFVAGIKAGSVLNRNGSVYKPSAVRGYEAALRDVWRPTFGSWRLDQVRRADLQKHVDKLVGDAAPSTIRNYIDPVRRIFDRALKRDDVDVNPTLGLEVPKGSGKRDRIASVAQALALLKALPDAERALWATAFFAGLRRGELRGLRRQAVDLDAGIITVEAGWDDVEGQIDAKSQGGERGVPIIRELRPILVAHLLATGRGNPDDLVFGRTATLPFVPSTVRAAARSAWADAGLEPFTLHEARHTFTSMMVAAGVDPAEVMRRVGHASVALTLERYTHETDGAAADTSKALQSYIDAARAS